MNVDAVSLRLPAFWNTSSRAWFALVESQFALRGIIQDDTKYHHVVSSLDTTTATRAVSVLANPPQQRKYDTIKDFLISTYGQTDEERASLLLSMDGLGDRKPSELMDIMLNLLGGHQPCFLFKQIFMRQLPDTIRIPLAASHIDDFRALAHEADKLFLMSSQPQIDAISSEVEIDSLRQKSFHSSNKGSTTDTCWYHRRFGKKARKCDPACKFFKSFHKESGNGRQGQH